jgi:hypothetical protein
LIWRFALADAADGAMIWRDHLDEIVAFNVAHRSGVEGWMGPLAVRTDAQGSGVGRQIVQSGISWLQGSGARIIGLETMPRTVENIGFYSRLGFTPDHLTITVTIDAHSGIADRLSDYPVRKRRELLDACRALTGSLLPGYDFTREIDLTDSQDLGATVVLIENDLVRGFALCHDVPLVEGRAQDEVRVLKLVAVDERAFMSLIEATSAYAYLRGAMRVAVRVQASYKLAYARLIGAGARVRWTDLRMTLSGFAEPKAERGVVLSNWEI